MSGAGDFIEFNLPSVMICCRALKTLLKVVLGVSQREKYLCSGDNEQGES